MKTLNNFWKNRNKIFIFLTLIAFFEIVTVYASDISKVGYINVSAKEANFIINTYQNLIILDLRGVEEYNAGHVTGAVSMPFPELENEINNIDIKKTLLVYSHDGEKSADICKLLWEKGYKSLFNLTSGISNWRDAELPLIVPNKQNNFVGRQIPNNSELLKSQKEIYNASDYCPSFGGSTEYEYIQSVTTSVQSEGVLSITVIISISNPENCIYGEPCPSYDASPEYINAWIDWNGNDTFEPGERVLNAALTGYLGINYRGSMSTSTIVTIPENSQNDTWIRVNLGWDFDPNDPCESSWDWGDVKDQSIRISEDPPIIEDIIITGISIANTPITNDASVAGAEKVKLEAKIKEKDDFEITEVNWSGEIKPGKGNPYEYIASPGSHGNKKVISTITYRHKTEETIGTDKKSKNFKLFFHKKGDDDSNGKPNWFKYWKTDGAVPDMNPAKYDAAETAYGYMTGAGELFLTPYSAGQHYTNPIELATSRGAESFGGPTVKGIDCAAEIIGHENYHKWVNDQWVAGGSFNGKTDTDKNLPNFNDKLPNFYEKATSLTDTMKTDSYDLEHKKSATYKRYGDNEYMAMRTGDNKRGTPAKDWAYPGKQTTPMYSPLKSQVLDGPVNAQFTGNYTDEGIDNNQDGNFDYLRITAELNVFAGGVFKIVAKLYDNASGQITFVNNQLNLETGIQSLVIDFDGLDIHQHGIDGPYSVTLLLNDDFGNEIDYKYNIHTTSAYGFNDFKPQGAYFSNEFSDSGIDSNQDGFFDSLKIEIGVNINVAGDYMFEGGLYDNDSSVIELSTANFTLDVGNNTVFLKFDGELINQKKVNGPYYLRFLGVSKEVTEDFILDAYTTSEYNYTEFQSANARFSGLLNENGKDIDSDGFFDSLTVEVGIEVLLAGQYKLIGYLNDQQNIQISKSEKLINLDLGTNVVDLNFTGTTIHAFGVDGPYLLRDFSLLDENGKLMDWINDADTTKDYLFTDFQEPAEQLIVLTGNYRDYKTDVDSNCAYEFLTVDVGVSLSDSGFVIVKAKLEDVNGDEIIWAENITYLRSDITQKIILNFDGLSIFEHGIDGPYFIKNVYIYHTGDPTIPDYVTEAHTSLAYLFSEFDTIPGVEIQIADTICEGENLQIGDSIFTKSGSYTIALTDKNECDSTVMLDLVVHSNIQTVENITICEGEIYKNWIEEGQYSETLNSITGCDSTVITNLTLYPSYQPEILVNGDTLSSVNTYQTYQWYDENGQINGENSIEYVISGSGEYYLAATDGNGCLNISQTVQVIFSSVNLFNVSDFTYSIIPNPNMGKFSFRIDSNPVDEFTLKLVNTIGQVIEIRTVKLAMINHTEQFDVSHLGKGIYYLVISSDNYHISEKILVK